MIDTFEDEFPGNNATYQNLKNAVLSGNLVFIVGAGVSAPKLPLWTGLIKELAQDALNEGHINSQDKNFIIEQSSSDPLIAATLLSNAIGEGILKVKVSKKFGSEDHITDVHRSLVTIPADAFLTLNYDAGIENALIERNAKSPRVLHPSEPYNLSEISRISAGNSNTVVHWHGDAKHPSTLVFTSEDYDKFYSLPNVSETLATLLATKTIVFVGFGFGDPYLTRFVKEAGLKSGQENRHFAIVSESDPNAYSRLRRSTYSSNYRSQLLIYSSEGGDHSKLTYLLDNISQEFKDNASLPDITVTPQLPMHPQKNVKEHIADRALSTGGSVLFVEPRLTTESVRDASLLTVEVTTTSAEDIAKMGGSVVVTAPHEYGLSTLGEVIEFHLRSLGENVAIRSAVGLPNYVAKLKKELKVTAANKSTLILDDVRPNQEKLMSAIRQLDIFDRVILLSHSDNLLTEVDLSEFGIVTHFQLLSLDRNQVSELATTMAPTVARGVVPAVIERTYRDLLSLAIPMTPANVIMYLSVAFRDYTFSPLSRIQIVEKYLETRLSRASDAYSDSFNSTNKIDLISRFAYELSIKSSAHFKSSDWSEFCRIYKSQRLISFDHESLLQDLEDSRIIVEDLINDVFVFSYRIFFAYFAGKFISERPDILDSAIKSGDYLKIEGLVEVITGLGKDNTSIIEDLTQRMERATTKFYSDYDIGAFDPHSKLEWKNSEEQEEQDWLLVEESLQEGPSDQQGRDKVQRDFIEELRSERQGVQINEDIVQDNMKVSALIDPLSIALANSIDVSGHQKRTAVLALISSLRIAFQIMCLHAPQISKNRFIVIEGIAFINANPDFNSKDYSANFIHVLSVAPTAVIRSTKKNLATKKLGAVFKSLAETDSLGGFDRLLNFNLLLKTKPFGWEVTLENMIDGFDKKELYLRYARNYLLSDFKLGINSGRELDALKRLVARIQLLRSTGKVNSGRSTIEKFVKRLEKTDIFEKKE